MSIITKLKAFLRNKNGQVSVVAGLTALPSLMLTGAAVDLSGNLAVKAAGQAAVDSAVIGLARNGSLDQTLASNLLKASLADIGATITSTSFTTRQDSSGNTIYVGEIVLQRTNSIMSVAGVSSSSIRIKAEAYRLPSTSVNTATFTPTGAQGAYSKDVFIWTKDATGKITSTTTVLTYRYSPSTGKTTSPALNTSKTFTVSPYTTYGVGLVIYQDLTYTGKLTNPVTVYSDASNAYTWLKSTGACTDSSGQQVQIEDGGDSNFNDLLYTMKCTQTTTTSQKVALIK